MKKLFARLIKDLRETFFKQTQKEFAEWLGVSKDVVFAIESGKTEPNASICLQLAAYARTVEERDYFFDMAGLTQQKVLRLLEAMDRFASNEARGGLLTVRDGPPRPYLTGASPPNPTEEDLLAKALEVLRRTDEDFSQALKFNIQGWYRAIQKAGPDEARKKEKAG